MLTCDLRGQVAGHQLSPFQFHRALSIGRSHAGSLCMAVRGFDLHTALDDRLRRNLC